MTARIAVDTYRAVYRATYRATYRAVCHATYRAGYRAPIDGPTGEMAGLHRCERASARPDISSAKQSDPLLLPCTGPLLALDLPLSPTPGAVRLLVVTSAVAATTAVVAVLCHHRGKAVLAQRSTFALVPAPLFDPTLEEVVRFAGQLTRVRPAVHRLVPRWATAVRVRITTSSTGRMLLLVDGPKAAESVLRLNGYRGVELRSRGLPAPPPRPGRSSPTPAGGSSSRPMRYARAELTLARDDRLPLRPMKLSPDPLIVFARALAELRQEAGDGAEIVLDLQPLTPAARRRRLERLTRTGGESSSAVGSWSQALDVLRGQAGAHRPRPSTGSRPVEAGSPDKVAATLDPVFAVQALVRTCSEQPGRAEAHLHAVLAGFETFSGENHWRVVGANLGIVHLGSDLPWRRRRFDERLATGRFAPRRPAVVTAGEIAAFLKPPTATCPVPTVLRSAGEIPPPPPLPDYEPGDPELLPLGWIEDAEDVRLVGVPLRDTFFSLCTGRSRYGKTESALTRFIALAKGGHGCLFLDPHADAIARIKPYLADIADRVVEIDLTPRGAGAKTAGWNLFSMEGRGPADVESRVAAVVDSFASTLRWGEVNNRAITVTTMASQALCELALVLPPEIAPTIFQLTTILSNEDWRDVVLPHLSEASRDFWTTRFEKLSPDAITPVTNLVDRLRSSSAVAALLGSSRSTYDIRTAMDRGQVVLACPAGTGDKDRLVANFIVYDLLQAALSRRDTDPVRRRRFDFFVDEMQTVDGASRNNLAALLEQAGKFGVCLHGMAQQPTRLTRTTLDALLTNRSHLLSTVVNADSAALLAREWGGALRPETVTSLERFTFLGSVTFAGQVSPPFLLRGIEVSELWGPGAGSDEVKRLDETIDATAGRRPVGEILAELDALDAAIEEWLRSAAQRSVPETTSSRMPPGRSTGLRTIGD